MIGKLLLAMLLKLIAIRISSLEDVDLASEIEVFRTVVLGETALSIHVSSVKIAVE